MMCFDIYFAALYIGYRCCIDLIELSAPWLLRLQPPGEDLMGNKRISFIVFSFIKALCPHLERKKIKFDQAGFNWVRRSSDCLNLQRCGLFVAVFLVLFLRWTIQFFHYFHKWMKWPRDQPALEYTVSSSEVPLDSISVYFGSLFWISRSPLSFCGSVLSSSFFYLTLIRWMKYICLYLCLCWCLPSRWLNAQ